MDNNNVVDTLKSCDRVDNASVAMARERPNLMQDDTSRALSCGDEGLQREAPYRERQKLENSLVFTKESQLTGESVQ